MSTWLRALLAAKILFVLGSPVQAAEPSEPAPAKLHHAVKKAVAAAKGGKGSKVARVPAPLVALSAHAPAVVQEMRYSTADNFTGAPVPGYESNQCWLLPAAAKALGRAQAMLEPWGLGLKVFDCYRPRRATAHFVSWSQAAPGSAADRATRTDYLPRVHRQDVFRLGYVSTRSGHSRGTTVDLTLVPLETPANAPRHERPTCNKALHAGSVALRDNELDMGTGFDCLDPLAHTGNPNIAPEVRAMRMLLSQVMREAGFVGYAQEWWHFTLAHSTASADYDFPIRAD